MDDDVVVLLDPEIQEQLRDALEQAGSSGPAKELLADSVAALTVIGRHPRTLRPAALTIMPTTARVDLATHGLIECHDADSIKWSLTPRGELLAEKLAEKAPPLHLEAQERAAAQLARLSSEAEKELGPFA